MAKRLPMVMVRMMTVPSSTCQYSNIEPKTLVRMMHRARAAAPLETTLR